MLRKHRKPTRRELAVRRTMLTRAWKVLSGYVVILVKWTGAREYRSAVSYAAAKSLAVREVFVNPHVYRHAWLMERDPYRSGGGG